MLTQSMHYNSTSLTLTLLAVLFLIALVQVLQPALIAVSSLQHLDLSHCNLSDACAEGLSGLIRNQSRRAMEQAWIQGLRCYDQGLGSSSNSRAGHKGQQQGGRGGLGGRRTLACGLEVLQLEGNMVSVAWQVAQGCAW